MPTHHCKLEKMCRCTVDVGTEVKHVVADPLHWVIALQWRGDHPVHGFQYIPRHSHQRASVTGGNRDISNAILTALMASRMLDCFLRRKATSMASSMRPLQSPQPRYSAG